MDKSLFSGDDAFKSSSHPPKPLPAPATHLPSVSGRRPSHETKDAQLQRPLAPPSAP